MNEKGRRGIIMKMFNYESTAGTTLFFVMNVGARWTVGRRRIKRFVKGLVSISQGKVHNPSWTKWFDTPKEAQEFLDDEADRRGYKLNGIWELSPT